MICFAIFQHSVVQQLVILQCLLFQGIISCPTLNYLKLSCTKISTTLQSQLSYNSHNSVNATIALCGKARQGFHKGHELTRQRAVTLAFQFHFKLSYRAVLDCLSHGGGGRVLTTRPWWSVYWTTQQDPLDCLIQMASYDPRAAECLKC